MKEKFIIVETTYPNLKNAKNLAEILFSQKLAACVHFLPIKSMYLWEGAIENSAEILLRIKTKKSQFKQIEKIILKHHEYEIPQIIAIEINQGSAAYLNWIDSIGKKQK